MTTERTSHVWAMLLFVTAVLLLFWLSGGPRPVF